MLKKNYFSSVCNFMLLLIARQMIPESCLINYTLRLVAHTPVAYKKKCILTKTMIKSPNVLVNESISNFHSICTNVLFLYPLKTKKNLEC